MHETQSFSLYLWFGYRYNMYRYKSTFRGGALRHAQQEE